MYKINNVYVLDEAESTNTPYNVKPAKYSAIAFMIGIVLSCAIIIIINILDTTVKTAEEIEKALKVPVIAQIPYYDDTVKKGGKK
jgi:capsular polysaccharide biosynthesis protein